MQIEQALLAQHSKALSLEIRDYIFRQPGAMSELMDCFFSSNIRLCQRASWPLLFIGLDRPDLITPYLHRMVHGLPTALHDAQVRNTIRILEEIPIPEDLEGLVYEHCFTFLADPHQAIAIRAFSMRVLERIASKHHDLISELVSEIQFLLPHASSGLKNRGKKIVVRLQRLLTS